MTATASVVMVNELSSQSLPTSKQGLEKPVFLEGPTYWVLGFCRVWGFIVFRFFLFERAVGGLLVDSAHQLSFYLDSPVL